MGRIETDGCFQVFCRSDCTTRMHARRHWYYTVFVAERYTVHRTQAMVLSAAEFGLESRSWHLLSTFWARHLLTINASKTSWEGSAFCSTSKAPSRWYPCLHVTCNVHVGHPTCKKENKLLVKWFAFTLRCFLIDIVDFFCDFFYASRQTHKAWRPLQGVGYNYFCPEAVATYS